MASCWAKVAGTLAFTLTACHAAPDAKFARGSGSPRRQPLRLEAVRFYEAGVGYFERSGTTRVPTRLALVVPQAHLDGALRTLVVLSSARPPVLDFESLIPPDLALERAEAAGAAGSGRRGAFVYTPAESGPLRLGYVTKVPHWLPTYRLLLPESGTLARLRASALVQNDTDEAWSGVRAVFASGRPQSLSSADEVEPHASSNKLGTLGARQVGSPSPDKGSFEYPALAALWVRSHGGALVPFLDAAVDTRPIVWFNGPKEPGKRAIRVSNATAQTLPQGLVAVYGSRGFVGETTLRRLEPGAYGFLGFAEESDVTLAITQDTDTDVSVDVGFENGVLVEKQRYRSERQYIVTNGKRERVDVYLSLEARPDARVTGFDRLDDAGPAGVFELEKATTQKRSVVIETDGVLPTAVEDLTSDALHALAVAPAIQPASARILLAAAAVAERIEKNTREKSKLEEQIGGLDTDVSIARSDVTEGHASSAARELVLRLFALEREYDAMSKRSERLTDEGERLLDALRRELARLPKPDPPS